MEKWFSNLSLLVSHICLLEQTFDWISLPPDLHRTNLTLWPLKWPGWHQPNITVKLVLWYFVPTWKLSLSLHFHPGWISSMLNIRLLPSSQSSSCLGLCNNRPPSFCSIWITFWGKINRLAVGLVANIYCSEVSKHISSDCMVSFHRLCWEWYVCCQFWAVLWCIEEITNIVLFCAKSLDLMGAFHTFHTLHGLNLHQLQ